MERLPAAGLQRNVSFLKCGLGRPHLSGYNNLSSFGSAHSCCAAQVTGGRNGYGAKLANIFSKEFTIETCDGRSLYTQVSLRTFQGFLLRSRTEPSTLAVRQHNWTVRLDVAQAMVCACQGRSL